LLNTAPGLPNARNNSNVYVPRNPVPLFTGNVDVTSAIYGNRGTGVICVHCGRRRYNLTLTVTLTLTFDVRTHADYINPESRTMDQETDYGILTPYVITLNLTRILTVTLTVTITLTLTLAVTVFPPVVLFEIITAYLRGIVLDSFQFIFKAM